MTKAPSSPEDAGVSDVAEQAVTAQRNEAIARRERPRIGVQPVNRKHGIALDETAAAVARDLLEGTTAHHAALLCRNS